MRASQPRSSLLLSHLPHARRVCAAQRPGPAARPQAPAVPCGGEGGEPRRRHWSAFAGLRRPDAGVRSAAPADKALGLRPAQRADTLHRIQKCNGRAWSPAHIRSLQGLVAYNHRRDPNAQTPVAVSSVEFIDPREPVMVVPILRAGLALAENASSILPATKTYHLGLRRDEETLQPSIYLNNLPDKIPDGTRVLVVDPMLATGGTIVATIDLLIDRGVTSKQIKVVSAVAAPPALQKLSNKFPGLHVYAGMIDSEVDEKGYIVPGLGDAGDRSFGT